MKDYYEVLGVPRDASPEQIKRAYRKLARKLHPDVAGPGHEEDFKEVSVAYETLPDPSRRRKYDMGGDTGNFGDAFGGFSDIFETFFGSGGAASAGTGPVPRGRRGQDSLTVVEASLADVTFGATKDVEINTAEVCSNCDGSCCKPGTSPRKCETCGGRGAVQRTVRSFLGQMVTSAPCASCQGHGTIIPDPCPECAGEGRIRTKKTIKLDIPAGVEHGTRIRMAGRGEVGPGGGPAGDLYFEIHEQPHPVFKRQGDELHTEVRVPMTAAALGTTFTLTTLDGDKELTLEPGTQPGEDVLMRGLGVTHLRRSTRGNLHVHINVEVPKHLNEEQRELLKQLAQLRGEEKIIAEGEDTGMFAKLRDRFTR